VNGREVEDAGVVAGAAVLLVAAELLYGLVDLRAPWSGATLVTAGLCLLCIGYAGHRVAVLALPLVLVCGPVIAGYVLSGDVGTEAPAGVECDPGCGIDLGAAVALSATVVGGLTSAGWLVRAVRDRLGKAADA
jgi:hypothetical protein